MLDKEFENGERARGKEQKEIDCTDLAECF